MDNNNYNSNFPYTLWDDNWSTYRINMEEAIRIALQQVPGQVYKIELDYDNDILVYEISIRTSSGEYEVYIDSNTGEILNVERD